MPLHDSELELQDLDILCTQCQGIFSSKFAFEDRWTDKNTIILQKLAIDGCRLCAVLRNEFGGEVVSSNGDELPDVELCYWLSGRRGYLYGATNLVFVRKHSDWERGDNMKNDNNLKTDGKVFQFALIPLERGSVQPHQHNSGL